MDKLIILADDIDDAMNKIPKNTDTNIFRDNALSWLFWAVGVVAVIMIVVSGLKMVTSAGDPGAVQKAKQTMIYSIIGLAIAILAYAIVNLVLDNLMA